MLHFISLSLCLFIDKFSPWLLSYSNISLHIFHWIIWIYCEDSQVQFQIYSYRHSFSIIWSLQIRMFKPFVLYWAFCGLFGCQVQAGNAVGCYCHKRSLCCRPSLSSYRWTNQSNWVVPINVDWLVFSWGMCWSLLGHYPLCRLVIYHLSHVTHMLHVTHQPMSSITLQHALLSVIQHGHASCFQWWWTYQEKLSVYR